MSSRSASTRPRPTAAGPPAPAGPNARRPAVPTVVPATPAAPHPSPPAMVRSASSNSHLRDCGGGTRCGDLPDPPGVGQDAAAAAAAGPVCYTFNLIRLPATDDVGGAHRAADPKEVRPFE